MSTTIPSTNNTNEDNTIINNNNDEIKIELNNNNIIEPVRKVSKFKEQATMADKIHHSMEYFDFLVVKDSPPTLAGAFFTLIVPILLIILGTAKWQEYNEPTALFTTTTYFTPAARTSYPTTIKCVPRGLNVGSFEGGGSMQDILSSSKCQSKGKSCVASQDCCDGPGWIRQGNYI